MTNKKPTYTLWHRGDLLDTYTHTRDGMDAAMEKAQEILTDDHDGIVELFSSRDDRVWSSEHDVLSDDWQGCSHFDGYEGY
jgi:hypothetical protein